MSRSYFWLFIFRSKYVLCWRLQRPNRSWWHNGTVDSTVITVFLFYPITLVILLFTQYVTKYRRLWYDDVYCNYYNFKFCFEVGLKPAEQSPWRADSPSAGHRNPCCRLWKPKLHYHIHNNPSLELTLDQMSSVRNFHTQFWGYIWQFQCIRSFS
jgi:hypothetical protein